VKRSALRDSHPPLYFGKGAGAPDQEELRQRRQAPGTLRQQEFAELSGEIRTVLDRVGIAHDDRCRVGLLIAPDDKCAVEGRPLQDATVTVRCIPALNTGKRGSDQFGRLHRELRRLAFSGLVRNRTSILCCTADGPATFAMVKWSESGTLYTSPK
jgi:hypothetical protein